MKKVLLTGAALVAMATSPAMAEGLDLDLAGHFKGYGVYNDNDEAAGVDLNDTAIRKETEIHFTGETTLDSGLTVGIHTEFNVDRSSGTDNLYTGGNGLTEEAYMYLSGGWGRINLGEEDGAAYLLQVAAPSADSNIDGLRQYITTYNATGTAGAVNTVIDYDHVSPGSNYNNKLTYMTPVFNGFQMGASYIPSISDDGNGVAAIDDTNQAGDYEDGYEVAARYEGAFEGVGMAFGAGWGQYNAETNAGAVSDDAETWNAGLDLDFAGFGLGVAYLEQSTESAGTDTDVDTLVVGTDYQLGAYKLGASWLNQDSDAAGAGEVDRYTGGVSYAYGPGMSFRGSVSYIDGDDTAADSTQVLLGTQVNF